MNEQNISSFRRRRNCTANANDDYNRSERRQWTTPSLSRVVKVSSLLVFCVFTLKQSSYALFAVMRGEYATDGHGTTSGLVNVTVGRDANESRHIWIDAISYAEGIAGWKTSLLELLYLAQELNATLVEPCMTLGRLGSCGGKFNIPVSDLFDLEEYKASLAENFLR